MADRGVSMRARARKCAWVRSNDLASQRKVETARRRWGVGGGVVVVYLASSLSLSIKL